MSKNRYRHHKNNKLKKYYWGGFFSLLLGIFLVVYLHHPQNMTKPITDASLSNTIEPKDKVSASIEQTLVEKNFSGTALVFKDGKIILNKAYGWQDQGKKIKNSLSTQYCIGSVQKGQTAYLIMQAIKAGKLSFTQKLSDFYPEIPNSENISIKDMLNMSSGLRINEKKVEALNTTDTKKILAETVRSATVAPTTNYSYQPVNYVLLAGVLEQLYQTNYQKLYQKNIIEAFGLKETSFYSVKNSQQALSYNSSTAGLVYASTSASSYADELGTGNIFMSAEDLYHYYQSLFDEIHLTTSERTQLWAPYTGETYASGIYNQKNKYYSHGVKARFETFVNFSKDGKDGIILLSNVRSQKNNYSSLSDQLYKKVVAQ
ncbi:serine hydrolase domain-containing protein [Enterococcus hermanniensis]|nr:serine hydrolase domain-containing protein [Enterococcus hermanniensis]